VDEFLTPDFPVGCHVQVVTHLCYSDFQDIMSAIDRMDGGCYVDSLLTLSLCLFADIC